MAVKSIKMPAINSTDVKDLSLRHKLFIDMYLVLNVSLAECYKMSFLSNESVSVRERKAKDILRSEDGVKYTKIRQAELEGYYFGGEETESVDRPKTVAEAMKELTPNFIEKMYSAATNPSDPNYDDTYKMFIQKSMKDIQTDKLSNPPLRYLAESCSECRYKLFVEKQGVIDECKRCRYKEYANQNGVIYTHKNQLK